MTPGVLKAQKEQRQFKSLKDTLSELGTKIEAAKKRLADYQFDTAEHARLTELLKDLSALKATLEPEVRALQTRHASLTEQISRIDAQLKPKQEKLEELTRMGAAAKEIRDTLKEEIRQLKLAKTDLTSSKREKLRKDIAEIEGDKVEANKALKAVNQAISKALAKSKALNGKAKRHDELMGLIAQATKALGELEENIRTRTAAHKRAVDLLEATEAEIAKLRTDFDAECRKKDIALKLKEKDLEQREGDVNRVKEWNKKRLGLLRDAKTELEEIHGRPLRHIIIPEDTE